EWLVPKAAQRYPDVGDDLDLLVLAPTPAIDRLMLEGLPVTSRRRTLAHRLSGCLLYALPGTDVVLDIHHGRLGSAGRHTDYLAVLRQRRRLVVIEGTEFWAPSSEDQLVLQGLEKVSGRRSFHLCDVLHTITAVRAGVDWEYVLRTARAQDGEAGLSCYLSYVAELHSRLAGRDLLPRDVSDALRLGGWGRVEFKNGAFRFPALRVNSRVYGRQFSADLRSGRWTSAARLCLLPLVAAAAGLRRLVPGRPSADVSGP
ncbi:MAG: nucleotidyltransferase family protein, partial [Gemmatimonadetes bacterium]|nr:nucleotidyltransferase family protein [Gemmatimonadota bacterium]